MTQSDKVIEENNTFAAPQENASMDIRSVPAASFEQCISSAELREVMSARADRPKKENDLDALFCKKYATIKIADCAPFKERMEFDIYKRVTKETRLDMLKNSQKAKLGKMQQEDLFHRLIEDGRRRNMIMKQLEAYKQEEEMGKKDTRKITPGEFERTYGRMMARLQETEIDLKRQRTFQQMLKECHEQKILESSVAYNKSKGDDYIE